MKPFSIIGIFALLAFSSCDKSVDPQELSGKWIEKSLRLDTIDFDEAQPAFGSKKNLKLASKSYIDPLYNPTYPINPSSIYSYYVQGDSIYMYNFVSSNSAYNPYALTVTSNNSFTIGKFYIRSSLPATVEFVRLK